MRWALVVMLVACKSEAEKKCANMAELAASCMKQLPSDTEDEMETTCAIGLVQERDSKNGRSLADDLYDAMMDCTQAKTCDELTACFDRRGCKIMMASPTATPHFQCWPPSR